MGAIKILTCPNCSWWLHLAMTRSSDDDPVISYVCRNRHCNLCVRDTNEEGNDASPLEPVMTNKTKRLLRNYVDAAIEMSWIGNRPAEERSLVRQDHRDARKQLVAHLEELECAKQAYNDKTGYGPPSHLSDEEL